MKIRNIPYYHAFLRSRELSLAGKLRLMCMPTNRSFEVNLLGRPIRVPDVRSFIGAYRDIFLDQHYRLSCGPGDELCILDCGANIGLASIYLKSNYPLARITAMEADPGIAAILDHNLGQFNFEGVESRHTAVWTHNGGVLFRREGGASGCVDSNTEEGGTTVPSVQLRRLLDEEARVDLLKIDIEGGEHTVLMDCAGALERVDRVFVEYHSFSHRSQHLSDLLGLFEHEGFRYHVKEAFVSPTPFAERDLQLGMDLQLNIFAFRTDGY